MEIQRGTSPKNVVKTNKNGILKSILVITILLSFTVLLVGGYWILKKKTKIPIKVTKKKIKVLLKKNTIVGGQTVLKKYGLMNYVFVLGAGTIRSAQVGTPVTW